MLKRSGYVLAFLAMGLAVAGCSEPARPRNAILIVLDTLRADRLSAYGHTRRTTPVLDRLAETGVLFEAAVSNASWTLPAMVGLLSGQYPTAEVYDGGLRLSLVERLREAGWKTAAFTGGAWVGEQYGFGRGFDHFEDQLAIDLRLVRGPAAREGKAKIAPSGEGPEGIEKTFGAAEQWLRENGREPFFLWVHTYEPHAPYRRQLYTSGMDRGILRPTFEVADAAMARAGRPGFELGETELRYVRALYDGGVTVADQYVGRLLETLDGLGLNDDTLIVVTSDHGEDLGERSPPQPGNHGHALWDELLLVPLIIFDPTREYPVHRVAVQARLIDTMPTILDILGLPAPKTEWASSLVPLMTGDEADDRPVWSVLDSNRKRNRPLQFAFRSGTRKLILTPEVEGGRQRSIELYDLVADPRERQNVASAEPERTQAMLRSVEAFRRQFDAAGAPVFESKRPIPPPVRRRLRALGYIE